MEWYKTKGGGYKQNYGIDMRAETGVAVGSVNAGGQVGNNNIGVVGEVGGALGSANAYAGFSARAGQETSIGFRVGAEASALELGASGGVNIFGYTIQVGVEGAVFDASAVAEFGVSNMQIKGRARLGLGLGAGFGSIYPKLNKNRPGGSNMFQSDSPFTKKLVIVLMILFCVVATLTVILSLLFSEKKPHIAAVIYIAIYDIICILVYFFYLRKK